MQLILPDRRYEASYQTAHDEYTALGVTQYPLSNPRAADIFAKFEQYRLGYNLKPGRVPATYLWLVEGDEFLAEACIRHTLTGSLLQYGGHIGYGVRASRWNQGYGTQLLALTLAYARDTLALHRILVTCNDDNVGSARVIEKNGGILENRVVNTIDGQPIVTRRYWIDIHTERN